MRVFIEDYGCTANSADTSKIERVLEERGHEIAPSEEESDAVLINTCTVIQSTQDRMLHRIEEVDGDVIVAGCMAKAQPELVRRRRGDANIKVTTGGEVMGRDKLEVPGGVDGVIGRLQVAEGCLGSCTYCLTRRARGELESLQPDRIEERARQLLDEGAREIRMTSQDNGAYGADIDRDLVDAVEAVLGDDRDFRLRIGMMNPGTALRFADSFHELYGDDRVYDFLHLPVQSGSDRLLERMGRGHDVETFLEVVEEFRQACPDGSLVTDVIPGFPGETERDHEATLELLERVEPQAVNITRFSPRPGTEAAGMDQLPYEVKKKRSRELTELRHQLGLLLYSRRVGETVDLLVVEEGKRGSVVGRDRRYAPVAVEEEVPIGKRMRVEIVEAESTYLTGERC